MRPWPVGVPGVLTLALALAPVLSGCAGDPGPLNIPASGDPGDAAGTPGGAGSTGGSDDPTASLRQVIQLIRLAATNPGGENFTQAAESLNDYFADARPEDFALSEGLRAFLSAQFLPPGAPRTIENPRFTGQLDGRHLEDCMLYRGVATSILRRRGARADDDLARASAIFDWVVRQVQLVRPGSLAPPPELLGSTGQTFQAPARPFDALLRGMATEVNADWAERSWLFLTLCKQVGLDGGLIAVVPPPPGRGVLTPEAQADAAAQPPAKALAAGVLIDGEVYLFDCRIGLPIPGPGGRGVATLGRVLAEPGLLEALDLSDAPYPVRPEDLADGRVRVLLEATLGMLSPRMRLLQERLTGENRMVLHRDPSEQAAAFARAVGPRLESVQLWKMPLEVEYRLFHDGAFTTATLHTLRLFDPRWPLLQARLEQLRGETETAVNRYVSFRFATGLVEADGRTPVPPEIQLMLNLFSTHFLALAQLDRGWDDEAEDLFVQTLKLFPEPGPGQPYFNMFRWGAHHNLGRLYEAEGRPELAARHYAQADPTGQSVGNRLRARPLIWSHPFVPDADVPPLPTPPAPMLPGGPVAATR